MTDTQDLAGRQGLPDQEEFKLRIREIQSQWLRQGIMRDPKDPLGHAMTAGEKAHDRTLAQLDKDVRAKLRLKKNDQSETAQGLRERFGPDTTHRPADDPEYQALRGLLSTGGSRADELEELLAQLLTEEDPAGDATQRGQELARAYREALAAGTTPVKKPRENSGLPPKGRGLSPNRLDKLAHEFQSQVTQAVRHCVRNWTEAETLSDQLDPKEAAAKIAPQMRVDQETLTKWVGQTHIPEQLLVLLLGDRGEYALQRTREKIIAANVRADAEDRALELDGEAREAEGLCQGRYGPGAIDMEPDRTYPAHGLRKIWEASGRTGEVDPAWTLITAGPQGQAARDTERAKGRQDRQNEETALEREAGLTEFQRAERRGSWMYEGPSIDMTALELTLLWQQENPGTEMPRRWWQQAEDMTTPEIRAAVCEEECAHLEYESARTRLEEARMELENIGRSAKKRRKWQDHQDSRTKIAQERLGLLNQASENATQAFLGTGFGEAPASDMRTPMPGESDSEEEPEQEETQPGQNEMELGVVRTRPARRNPDQGRRGPERKTPDTQVESLRMVI